MPWRASNTCVRFTRISQDRIHEAEYGHDLQTCQEELDAHHKEHKVIDQFQVMCLSPPTPTDGCPELRWPVTMRRVAEVYELP